MSMKKFVVVGFGVAVLCSPVLAEDNSAITRGDDEFLWNCADCHGFEGKGDGPLAEVLIKKPADLTQIAKNNLGIFPKDRIFDMIAGRENVTGHQSFQMPKFWERFQQSEGRRGFDKPEVRIKAIVDYLETIQAK